MEVERHHCEGIVLEDLITYGSQQNNEIGNTVIWKMLTRYYRTSVRPFMQPGYYLLLKCLDYQKIVAVRLEAGRGVGAGV